MVKKNVIVILIMMLVLVVAVEAFAGEKKTAFALRDWMGKNETFKTQLVTSFIAAAKNDRVTIRLPVEYYVREIDLLIRNSIANGEEQGLDNSWAISFKTIAAMEGDWDNGKDKLEFAKELMGPEIFRQFL
ncbi:MAG: hypothetical protein M0009_08890 [Deltaproteobacteria bacterium]|nr:hypothetical protein [Deltaproteobacteria bacterium]